MLHHTFAINCPMNATDPPVNVLLTDGLNQGFFRPVEQVQLIYSFSFILLHHLLFLPEDKICYISDLKSIIFLDLNYACLFSSQFSFFPFIYHWKTFQREGFWILWIWCMVCLGMVRLNNVSILVYSIDLESGMSWNKGIQCAKTVDEWKPGALETEIC